jgi:hypothetical protein
LPYIGGFCERISDGKIYFYLLQAIVFTGGGMPDFLHLFSSARPLIFFWGKLFLSKLTREKSFIYFGYVC